MTTYNTNLAAEFYVLSMLHRLGADAALTLGNKKAVDIIVANENKTITTVEVKGLAKAYDWPADNIHSFLDTQHFYVIVQGFFCKLVKVIFAFFVRLSCTFKGYISSASQPLFTDLAEHS